MNSIKFEASATGMFKAGFCAGLGFIAAKAVVIAVGGKIATKAIGAGLKKSSGDITGKFVDGIKDAFEKKMGDLSVEDLEKLSEITKKLSEETEQSEEK